MNDMYWSNLNSCFNSRRYEGSIFLVSILFTGLMGFRNCTFDKNCFRGGKYIVSSLEKMNTLHFDDRLPNNRVFTSHNLLALRKLGIISKEQNWYDARRILLRLLFNPSEELIKSILEEKEKLFGMNMVLGLHIRSGGLLSDSPERIEMLSPDMLFTISNQVFDFSFKHHINRKSFIVFLSSDSKIIDDYMIRKLNIRYQVVISKTGTRGHSTLVKSSSNIVAKAITDLYLLATCDYLVVGSKSGYGQLAGMLWKGKIYDEYIQQKVEIENRFFSFVS